MVKAEGQQVQNIQIINSYIFFAFFSIFLCVMHS